MSYFHILFSVPFSLIFPIHQKQNQYSTVCFLNISLWLNDSVHTNTDPMHTAYAYLYIYKGWLILSFPVLLEWDHTIHITLIFTQLKAHGNPVHSSGVSQIHNFKSLHNIPRGKFIKCVEQFNYWLRTDFVSRV